MLIIRGINVYPRTIEAILMDDPEVSPNYALIVDRRSDLPELEARVEVADADMIESSPSIAERLQRRIMETVRLRVTVHVGPPGYVPRAELGKAKRVFERTSDEDPLS